MDANTPLQLQAYGGLTSAAKQQNPYMFSFDQTAVKNIANVGANTVGKPSLPPLSAIGNDKFDWGNDLNGGALPSPNIYQHKSSFPYTPIITGAPFSSLQKGQNFFNFTNPSMNDDQQAMNQMTNSTNANNNVYATAPSNIQQLYGDNLNQLYGNTTFNGSNLQAAVTANSLMQTSQPNYQVANGGINTLGAAKLSEEASTPFKMDNAFQFNFNNQAINNQNNAKNPSSAMIQVANNNNKPQQNGIVNSNQQNDYLNHNQMKFNQNGMAQPSQFMAQQQQFAQQQNQQGQQNQQIQQQQIPQSQQQQQFQNFQKTQFLNGTLNNFGNNTSEQQFQGDSNININQLTNSTTNGAANPQQQFSAIASAAANQSPEKKKPQISLSLQIPSGNSMNNTNNQNPQTNTNNPNNVNQTANGPLNTADGSGFAYFSQYPNNLGIAPFTPLGPTTIGFQQLNGAPPSSHRPPFTAQRTGGLYNENFFFNTQTIPEQYPLLTPGNNTGYNKQSFFYPTADQTQAVAQSQFQQMQYDQTKYQHPGQPQTHPNNPQHFQQHTIPFHQQQQQQQQNPYQQQQTQNTQQQQNLQQLPQGNIGKDQQQIPGNTDNKNDPKNKILNLKLDISASKDHIFSDMQNFEIGQQKDIKNGILNFNNNQNDSNKGGANGSQEDDKDKNIISMLQKNNPQNSAPPSTYFDAANMSLIIDFYQKANPEKKQQLYDFLSNQQNDDKDDNQKSKSQKIIEHIITSNTKRIGTLTISERHEKIKRYREKRQRRANTSLVKYKKQQIAVSKKPRDKNGKFLKQLDEEGVSKKKTKKK